MKYMKRANIYKANNVTFNPVTCQAVSYNWWTFVARIDGVVIFNDYFYSQSTAKQQSKVRALLNQLNINIDIRAPFPKGIDTSETLENLILQAEENECNRFLDLEERVITRNERAKMRRDKQKDEKRRLEFLDEVNAILQPGV